MTPTTIDYGALFTDLQVQVMAGITAVTPLAVSILGVMLAISVGMKLFRRFTGR